MFPRERVRNPNQRLIPLTPQLIQDMLEHENLEYQTPPGGHRRSSINQKIADKLKKNQIIFTKRQEKMNRKTQKRTDLESEAEIEKTRNQKNSLDVLLPARTLLSSSSDKAATLKGLIKKSSKFVTKSRIKRLDRFSDEQSAKRCSRGVQCIKTPTRRLLYTSSSESAMSFRSGQTKEVHNNGMYNYHVMHQCWINAFVVPKSRTSFLLNRHKLQNFRTYFKN
ncbi:uncharacterized protein LOC117781189 isoform X1 [Drosophila innubila]|uniref:uncharacterized protein LOC117781189 isoform X1 n=1 Tax=Drosophila innubila TaxID=198719 RepID=UPI00148DF119|nr:uncharacterized protein LOC117781189 isoform X1 [Drosophila innubila]